MASLVSYPHANGSSLVFLGRDALEGDMVFGKGILKVLGAIVF